MTRGDDPHAATSSPVARLRRRIVFNSHPSRHLFLYFRGKGPSQPPGEEAISTDLAPNVGTLLRDARKSRGWPQLRLIREMREVAARHGHRLVGDDGVKRRLASWENGHNVPDEFYGPILCETLGMTAAELGLNHLTGQDARLLEASYPPSPDAAITAVDQLWRADLHGSEPLILSESSGPAWNEASLRWLVAPEPSFPSTQRRDGAREGLADVLMIKSARCVAYLAEFRQHLTHVGDTAAVRDFHEQAAEHRLWVAAGGVGVKRSMGI